MKYMYNHGGRATCYKGEAGDCVTRSISIITGLPYQEVYDELFSRSKVFAKGRSKAAKNLAKRGCSPRNGVLKKVYEAYLKELGYVWFPTMHIGKGCKVHLRDDELPKGRIIVRVSKHLTSVIDGVLHDTYDCSRGGTRCVYGYFTKIYKTEKRI